MFGSSPRLLACLLCAWAVPAFAAGKPQPDTLPNTKPLLSKGDLASEMVDGIDRFLLREIAAAAKNREKFWKRDLSSAKAYDRSIEPQRKQLAHILGVRDERVAFRSPELAATVDESAVVGKGPGYEILAVRWPVVGNVHAEGLLLRPSKGKPVANVVAVADADVTPEQLCGLSPGLAPEAQYARRLAESGCRVLIPALIDRTYESRNNRAKMTNREFIYRSAFELGRHLIGYEVQKVLAGVDWFAREADHAKIGVIGWGEGGMLALYCGALDRRIQAVCVSGYFGPRERIWEQPIERNVFGLLQQFGDAELLSMIYPRTVVVDLTAGPERTLPSEGGAPSVLRSPDPKEARQEFARVKALLGKAGSSVGTPQTNTEKALQAFLGGLSAKLTESKKAPEQMRKQFDARARQLRQFRELDRHNQELLAESPYVRTKFMGRLDTSSADSYARSVESYRDYFATEVIGRFDHKLAEAHPRTKKLSESEKWIIYQVVLDVFPDVFAYGLLIIPKDLKPGEKRPVVVCQHGLEGRPEDCIGDKNGYNSYKAFATRLAERGFITFAPQNPYIFRDRFRSLQRKANPIKKTLFSIIVPQHQQITDWLGGLPFVDKTRIGFYGLSYGGKSAMRIPPLVKNYCLSICSADFNDWVWKNASSRSPYSYVWTMEYEIFEFDLGSTFNYSEMAALIAPRPFMVERGHFDGVAPDERVALEYAKVRHLYQARLGLGDKTTIEWFVGPHTINGKGTFHFLHKHLNWPQPGAKK